MVLEIGLYMYVKCKNSSHITRFIKGAVLANGNFWSNISYILGKDSNIEFLTQLMLHLGAIKHAFSRSSLSAQQ